LRLEVLTLFCCFLSHLYWSQWWNVTITLCCIAGWRSRQ